MQQLSTSSRCLGSWVSERVWKHSLKQSNAFVSPTKNYFYSTCSWNHRQRVHHGPKWSQISTPSLWHLLPSDSDLKRSRKETTGHSHELSPQTGLRVSFKPNASRCYTKYPWDESPPIISLSTRPPPEKEEGPTGRPSAAYDHQEGPRACRGPPPLRSATPTPGWLPLVNRLVQHVVLLCVSRHPSRRWLFSLSYSRYLGNFFLLSMF